MPATSIIIITHNRPQLLKRAVDSARVAGRNLEIVVVDNASHEETEELCKSLRDIRYVRIDRKLELGGARNVGLTASSGKYVTFLDDDDVRLPNTIDQQIEILEAEPSTNLIYGQAILADQDGNPTRSFYPANCPQGSIYWQLLVRNFIPCGSVVFRRSCLSTVGLFNENIPRISDWDLWVRIAELHPISAVTSPVFMWRRSTPASGQATSHAAQVVLVAVRQFRQYWMKSPRAARVSSSLRNEAWIRFSENMVEHLLFETLRAIRFRQIRLAFANLLTIRHLHPAAFVRITRNRIFRKATKHGIHIGLLEQTGLDGVNNGLPESV